MPRPGPISTSAGRWPWDRGGGQALRQEYIAGVSRQLILHDKVREVFESSLRLARESGYLKRRSMRVALDTTNILGRGAVKDTYNLLADGIVKLLRALAQVEGISVGKWAKAQGYGRYLASSIRGEAAIDWSYKGSGRPCWVGLWPTRTG